MVSDDTKNKILNDPYTFIDEIFANAMIKNNNDLYISLNDMNEKDQLESALLDSSFTAQIPYLTKSAVGNNAICFI